ncbi:MAG: hypothetical protein ACJ0GN_03915 [Candidatus Actinomarina sp.]|tara:strand:- start:4064 stop:4726 length:663 start_codon:yes stop_codon:yes gene_type:complete
MIFNNFEKYKFNGTEVVGLKTTINFSKDNDIDIVLHEETQDKFEQVRDLETVKDFPPLVFSVEIDRDVINNLDIQNQIQKLILLDGHHRFEHLSLYNYDYPIPVVLVSNQDVKIQSYNSKINVTKEQFIEFLIVNDFEPSSSKYFLSIQDNNYSNKKINSIYELYDFKRKLINSNLINPIRNDVSGSEDIIVNFTPIKLIEFYRENYLFPPKSTWISPRI